MPHALLEQGTLLHVGCGPERMAHTPFAGSGWRELRLDIDPAVAPDLVGSLTDLGAVADGSVDAVFSAHPLSISMPMRCPPPWPSSGGCWGRGGLTLITCPDLQAVAALVAEDRLLQPAYISAMGPISPLDILYGHLASLAAGSVYVAHRCGFTCKVLQATVQAAGFAQCCSLRRPRHFDLWLLATVEVWPEPALRAAVQRLFPRG